MRYVSLSIASPRTATAATGSCLFRVGQGHGALGSLELLHFGSRSERVLPASIGSSCSARAPVSGCDGQTASCPREIGVVGGNEGNKEEKKNAGRMEQGRGWTSCEK